MNRATGAGVDGADTATDFVSVLLPFASVTVSTIVYVLADAYVCDAVFEVPDALAPSPKENAYVAPASAVLPLASKLHTRPLQLGAANRATGAVPVDPPPMNAVYRSLFGEPVPGLFTVLTVALPVRAVATCAGVAVGLASR